MTNLHDTEQACAGLAGLLDHLRARGTVPAGTRGRIFATIDLLRATGAPQVRIDAVGKIALTVHGLEWARLQQDSDREDALWRELDALVAEWTGRQVQSPERIHAHQA